MRDMQNKNKLDLFVNLLILTLIIVSLFLGLTNQISMRLGSDVFQLIHAVNDFKSGVDPYRHMDQSMFVYHPYVLKTLVTINNFMPLSKFLFLFYVCSVIWFSYQSCQWLVTQMHSNVPKIIGITSILFISLSFGGITITSLLSGNLSAYFHLILIGLIFHYSVKKNNLTLYVLGFAIVLFSVVKPYLLAYSLFFLLFFKKRLAVMIAGIVCICTGLIWLSGIYFQPELYDNFLSALQYQLLTKDDLGGFSSLRILGPILGIKVAFLVHVGFVLLVLYILLILGPSKTALLQKSANQLLILLILIIFINPRMVFYDFYITVFLLAYLVYLNLPTQYNRILLPGFLLALVSQFVVHPTRWVILAYCCVVFTFLISIVLFQRKKANRI